MKKKQYADASCYDLALDRLRYVFERADVVTVSFSGGKDSTACLNLALQVATELDRLPLEVFTFDEEAIPPETVEYMARVALRPEIRFHWYCAPIEHRNACSRTTPHWYPWAPEDEAKWCRPLPPGALTTFPGFTRAGIADQMAALYPASRGTVAQILGIRTQESLSRFRAIALKSNPATAFISPGPARHIQTVYPIYDWATEDVWLAPDRLGWDYNRAYDVMDAAGIPRSGQRCSPPYGEQPIRRLHTYKTCWPELWHRMVDRVPGAATAARYANTELYAIGVEADDLPPGMTWRTWTILTLKALQPVSRKEAASAIRACIVHHQRRSPDPIPDAEPHPVTGQCWKTLFIAAKVGGNKFDRMHKKMDHMAMQARTKRGVSQR